MEVNNDSFRIQCISPPIDNNSHVMFDISVNSGNDKTDSGQIFRYYSDPVIARIYPTYGFAGDIVTLHGKGFINASGLKCYVANYKSPKALGFLLK